MTRWNASERSPSLMVHPCDFDCTQNDVSGSPLQGAASVGGFATARDLVRFALCSACQEENLAQFNFCWKCGVQPARVLPAPRFPQRAPVVVDVQKMQARRHQVLTAMEGRPGQVRKSRVADEFDAFVLVISAGSRGWTTATPDDVFDFLCYCDTQGKGTKMVHVTSCPGVGRPGDDACLEGSACAKRYAAESIRKGFVSKLKMAMKEHGKGEEWDPVRRAGNPCASPLVDSYLTFVSEEQKQVGVPVNQAAPMLGHTLMDLLSDMSSRAQVATSLAERISLTRDIALYSLAFFSMRRGYDLSFTLGSQILKLPGSKGLIFNFQFGKTLRASSEAVVVLADRDCPAICAFRAVKAYISAAQRIGWDLTAGHLFPVITTEGGRGSRPLSGARMTASLQGHLREAGLPSHFTMHSFRVGGSLSRSLAGTAVDEIMKIGGWKTESIAKYYIGATSSGKVRGGKRKRGQSYADASELPLSPEFEKDFAACAGKV